MDHTTIENPGLPDLTEQEKKLRDQAFDTMSPVEFFKEMVSIFGVRRTTDLIGWAVLWGAMGIDDVSQMRKKMFAEGMSDRAGYRAAADFRKFGDHMMTTYQRKLEMKEIIAEIATLKTSPI